MAKRTKKTKTSNQKSRSSQGKNKERKKIDVQVVRKSEGRVDAFAKLAERIAEGEAIVPPTLLSGLTRRLHVRTTMREDHQNRIEQRAHGAKVKFDQLAGDLFLFFRGTALLFYRDMIGQD